MQNVAIMQVRDLRPEQVLAADVRDRSGRLLIPAGMSIKEKHLRVLMSWGITEVTVRGDPALPPDETVGTAAPLPTDVSPEIQQRLDDLFRHVDLSLPHMRTLHALTESRMTEAA